MIRNYITIGLRNIWRNISFTSVNVAGLSLGITCCLILFLMISFQTSFDNYHTHGKRIYRIVSSSINNNGIEEYGAGVSIPFPEALRSQMTGIEKVLFISSHGRGDGLITIEENGDKRIFEEKEGVTYTDSLYFEFFDRKIISGISLLAEVNQAVISQKLARKYFGDDVLPVGRTFKLDNITDITISGVMEDYPENTDFPFDIIISYATVESKLDELGWGSVYSDDQCYVLLEQNTRPEDINRQFPAFVEKYENKEGRRRWLQPLREVHHDTRISNFGRRPVSMEIILAMGIVAVFLVITACINFINLTTAISVRRSKEVGVRKVLGSHRAQLMLQYLSETGLIVFFALLLSVGFTELGLILLNTFLGLNLHINSFQQNFILFVGGMWLLITISAGLYPAFLLSGFSPALALKNKITNRGSGSFMMRRTLVVFQFAISQFFIIGTVIVLSQMNYFNTTDLGFRRHAIITVPVPEKYVLTKKTTLKHEVERLPGVEGASLCTTPPSSGSTFTSSFKLDGIPYMNDAQLKIADTNYLDLFEINLIAGNRLPDSDTTTGWVVNEKLVETTGLMSPEEIVGRNLNLGNMNLPVVGVVRDFHTVSLEREINPTILFSDLSSYVTLSIKLSPGSFSSTIEQIKQLWSQHYPDFLFTYEFLDDHLAGFYEETKKMSILLIVFSSIAIMISCLGLYGLVSFMASEKEKEIGIRKVLGATIGHVVLIFSKEFMVLIVIGFAIAVPLSGYIMSKWLQNFEYRVPLGWGMFAAGITVTLLIAFITVAYRSIRAATTNPVDALRAE